jgi:hypothetical protein
MLAWQQARRQEKKGWDLKSEAWKLGGSSYLLTLPAAGRRLLAGLANGNRYFRARHVDFCKGDERREGVRTSTAPSPPPVSFTVLIDRAVAEIASLLFFITPLYSAIFFTRRHKEKEGKKRPGTTASYFLCVKYIGAIVQISGQR